MKNLIIAQKYLAPYRVNLFNLISENKNIELSVIYYGKKEKRRVWKIFPNRLFKEINIKHLQINYGYEKSITIPLFNLNPFFLKNKIVVCSTDFFAFYIYLFSHFVNFKYIIWTEMTYATEKNISYFKKIWRKILFKKAKAFIVPGLETLRYIKSYNVKSSIYFMKNSVDDEFQITKEEIIKKFSDLSEIYLLFSGSLFNRKGVEILINSIKELNKLELKRKFKLIILGQGPLKIEKIENIDYMGFIEGKKYIDLFKNSHIFILPSYHDSNPLVTIEAIKSGNILVISKNVGNYPEVLRNNGKLIEPLDERTLTKILSDLINESEESLLNMALNSYEISQSFSHKKSAESFINIVKDI